MSSLFRHLACAGAFLCTVLAVSAVPLKVVTIAPGIPEAKLLKPAEFEGNHDPHVWGDASLWALCVDPVVKTLCEADPAGAADFQKRGETLKADLARLHDWALKRAKELPAERRVLITSHDAFNYLGRAYGFQVVGVQGISTVTEAGLADIAKVVDFINQKGVKAIFVESSIPRAAIERISQDSGAKVGGELFLKHNINTAVEALK